jgi:nucleoside-diphosphate-sugar epimerase
LVLFATPAWINDSLIDLYESFNSTYFPIKPIRTSDFGFLSFCKTNNIPWTWIRPCYVYGPGDVDTRLIPTVINKLLNKENVYLDACQKIIDYIYIDDFTNYVYDIIIKSAQGVYNVCSGQQYYLQNVITMIGSLLNATNYINYDNTLSRNLTSTCICGSNLKIKQLTSFAETISLAEGLQKTINFYKNKK